MLGYSNNAQANQETFSAGWLRTGDLGYYDRDGFIFVVDRIKVTGMQVAPAELEDALRCLGRSGGRGGGGGGQCQGGRGGAAQGLHCQDQQSGD